MDDKYNKRTVKRFSTIEGIVEFLLEEEASNSMKIDVGSMKVLFDIHAGKITDNFYIGNQGMYAKETEIRVVLLEDDNNLDFQTVVLERYPIICFKRNGKEYMHYDIESSHQIGLSHENIDYDKYDADFKTSKAAMVIHNRLKDSNERVNTFKL